MKTLRGSWSLAGIAAGLSGVALSYLVASVLSVKESPVVAVAQAVIRLTPGSVAEALISVVGRYDKTLLVIGVLVVISGVFALAGRMAKQAWWGPVIPFGVLAVIGGLAVAYEPGATVVAGLPVVVGFVTWVVVLSSLTEPLVRAEQAAEDLDRHDTKEAVRSGAGAGRTTARTTSKTIAKAPGQRTGARSPAAADSDSTVRMKALASAEQTRRSFLVRVGVVGASVAVLGVAGRLIGGGRRKVEAARQLLRLDGVSSPVVPADVRIGVDGVAPWLTPVNDFYRIDTSVVVPVIEPSQWSLRIHGAVDKEITITYADLMKREITEGFITICCVSNPVGGNLIGNAWWSGVRIADLLAEAGVAPEADAVLQTSDDGWTCGTPLEALTDDRNAILAVAMDGRPLPIEHGFPVRSIVPGLYGYVSATKWVVDMEVTQFSKIDAYWTQRGWGERGPIKLESRIDVPSSGAEVPAGTVQIGGVAWAQHTGISAVEFAIDGGDWQPARIADTGLKDSWVQWAGEVEVDRGDHLVWVRATDANGVVQDQTERDVLPDGATGYHRSDFSAS